MFGPVSDFFETDGFVIASLPTTSLRFSRSRSMRRSVRGGSVKVGGKMGGQTAAHAYSEHMKENGGEIGRSLHDFDIKMLQQKRQVSFLSEAT